MNKKNNLGKLGKFSFLGIIALAVILVFSLLFFLVGEFLYSKFLDGEIFSYKSNLALVDSTLQASYSNFDVGKTPVPPIGKSIIIDVKNTKLHLFDRGVLFKSFSLISIPTSGSAWETSGGSFAVIRKKEDHFSPIAKIRFPYTIQFFGNSLIHGEPTNNKSQKIKTDAGGFRLKTKEAAEIFDWIDIDTRVLVYGARWTMGENNHFSYIVKKSKPRALTANSYLVADLKTKEVILSKNKDKMVPVASVTKLMTALIAFELFKPEEEIEISRQAYETYGGSGYFRIGDKFSLEIMLYPLLLESSNDAAEAIAERAGRDKFIARMNKKAKELGMTGTIFEDPSGLSPNNISSAEDLVRLADYIHQNKAFLFEITKLKEYKYGRFVWTNRNNLIGMNYYAGGKNGYTDEANRTLLALFELPLSEFENRKIVLVLLGSDDRKTDTKNIINYVAGNVSYSGPSVFKPLDNFGWEEL
ncbi:MAG: serine hydrolase [Candidatus Paceibacterota bacterium]|jgi:hypothetical protein